MFALSELSHEANGTETELPQLPPEDESDFAG